MHSQWRQHPRYTVRYRAWLVSLNILPQRVPDSITEGVGEGGVMLPPSFSGTPVGNT